MRTIRTFIAIDLSEEVKQELSRIINLLNRSGENVKWVKPDNMHLTLKFLGNVEEDKLSEIEKKLEDVSKEFQPFDIDINELGAFPNWRNPRVVWVGIGEGKEVLKKLADSIEGKIEELGFEKEKREFKAHLTLGRVKNIKNKQQLQEIADDIQIKNEKTKISKIVLFKSILTPQGAIYTPIKVCPLP